MTSESTRLSVTSVGRVVAQSVLHPLSAHQLIEYAANNASNLLDLSGNEADEATLYFTLIHAAFSSDEYSLRGSGRILPYQLDNRVQNTLADQASEFLMERPWERNPVAANAAMTTMRWSNGCPMNELALEFDAIGSGVLQTMIREVAEILFAWSDCLTAGTAPHLVDEDRPQTLRGEADLRRALRNLASIIRTQARMLSAGLPGDIAWMASLSDDETGRRILTRPAILALSERGLTDPVDLLRHGKFGHIKEVLEPIGFPDINDLVQKFQRAVRLHRQERRQNLWTSAVARAPDSVRTAIERLIGARGRAFEEETETILDAVGIAYQRLDNGKTPGAPDLLVGLNHKVQVVIELKSAEGEGTVGLNEATDVIKGAAIVELDHLPKATLANPGFDANVPWQARNVRDLALVEACQFGYGASLLALGDIDKDAFIDWLSQPGMLSVVRLSDSLSGAEHR